MSSEMPTVDVDCNPAPVRIVSDGALAALGHPHRLELDDRRQRPAVGNVSVWSEPTPDRPKVDHPYTGDIGRGGLPWRG
jgi:hypothetical protein